MTGKTILLVEDNPKVMRNNIMLLKSRGGTVIPAATFIQACSVIEENTFDLAVLDIMLPDGCGFDLLKKIREMGNQPVLLLTAKDKSRDVVEGLSLGADDYLAKPYDLNVFAARIDALLRRSRAVSEYAVIGPLRFDLLCNQAFYGEQDLLLTQKEFALLFMLAQNEKRTLTAEYLFEKAWGQPMSGDNATFKVQMSNLKKKLFAAADKILIETSRGEGYCLTIF